MTYWMLNALFLAAVAVVVTAAVLLKRSPRWRAVLITLGIVLLMTAVFDNIMIGIGLVDYNPELTEPARLGVAPLEDFAYAIAAAVALPTVWALAAPASRKGQA